MFKVTRFCVQAFERRGPVLVRGESREYSDEGAARRAGATMRRRSAGVALYSVTGEPVSGLWKEPQLLEALGEVPLER